MSKLRGLPSKVKMRHDYHFVEELGGPTKPEQLGRMLDLNMLDVNPHQPRKTLGDLSELVASIKEQGVLQPILVRKLDGRYQIIAGERRYHASRSAGLSQVPCIEMEVDDRGVMEISLIENLQRRDLTPFEEADSILYLCERFEYTHEKLARKLSKSRTTITEMLSIAGIPEAVRDACRRADISSKSLLVEIARQNSDDDMLRLIEAVRTRGLSRDDARRMKNTDHDPSSETPAARPFVFKFKSPEKRFSLNLRFDRPGVDKSEIVSALRELIEEIEASDSVS